MEDVTVTLTSEEVTAISDVLRRVYPTSMIGLRPAFRSGLRKVNAAKLRAYGLDDSDEVDEDWWWTGSLMGFEPDPDDPGSYRPTEQAASYEETREVVARFLLDPHHPDNTERRTITINP